jgi:hypothetical protein
MELKGHVRNGVVVFDGPAELPEGAAVSVRYPAEKPPSTAARTRVTFPLVRSANPGSIRLTNDRIGEILDEEDLPPRR